MTKFQKVSLEVKTVAMAITNPIKTKNLIKEMGSKSAKSHVMNIASVVSDCKQVEKQFNLRFTRLVPVAEWA